MFKNIGRRNPAVSAPPEVDWTGDQLDSPTPGEAPRRVTTLRLMTTRAAHASEG